MRASTFRCFRHILLDVTAMETMLVTSIDIFVIRSLERESKYVLERMEALKVVRKMMEINAEKMPEGIIRSLVSISMQIEDPFRGVALETIRVFR